jgi:xanthine dehydrogenase accessory factor
VRDILTGLRLWTDSGDRFGLATVVRATGSAPRGPGAAMAVVRGGQVLGSVSGGCVEGAVYELAAEVASSGVPIRHLFDATGDGDLFASGLTCGGVLDVFVEPVDATRYPELAGVTDSVLAGEPVAVATVINGPLIGTRLVVWPDRVVGSLGERRLDGLVTAEIRSAFHHDDAGIRRYGELEVFVACFAPPPRMLVFGALDVASSVASMGSLLGFHVTVCDARAVFATPERFPTADEVVVAWPHRYLAGEVAGGRVDGRTAMCVLTHDPKFDVPLLEVALRTPVGYVGAMGSRRTHDDRVLRLRERGITDAELARLSSPIGLDVGSSNPSEIAVSIAAEIVAIRRGGTGERLSSMNGAVHPSRKIHTVMMKQVMPGA